MECWLYLLILIYIKPIFISIFLSTTNFLKNLKINVESIVHIVVYNLEARCYIFITKICHWINGPI